MTPIDKAHITRFAPSPNGRLHLGHAYSALMAQKLSGSGRFILRIEDIDLGRRRQHFIDAIYEDLAWLGLSWPIPVMVQSDRFDIYQTALNKLRDMEVVYPCWASRADIRDYINSQPGGREAWPVDPDGAAIYPGLYKDISPTKRDSMMWEGGNYAWRLDSEKAAGLARHKNGALKYFEASQQKSHEVTPSLYGDVVLARKDIPTSYHLSVVVDDAAQDISMVTRGMDLQGATHIHRILQILLEYPEPDYYHHDLVREADGRRLSKRAGDIGIDYYRSQGYSPEKLIDELLPSLTL
ncbi:MAG: tRNA glutamyl-Q(34) synthetase GluQRS [Candidatus Micropelagos sp.]|nr:tRNA glutamyl-Q(34) synthetase GluQRS [Hyphomicrobiales bacterium]NCG10702.1 tRNA glutamyl-Q(34) synthetase GluQRS [Alphaproteobacteria bacterium]OUV50487.1 MAG: tRNA glutamyl-Q(34) synthetase GluQRS [Alphaproteobacteria bacterium TMED110]